MFLGVSIRYDGNEWSSRRRRRRRRRKRRACDTHERR
jgi:hypothetical protein